MFHVLLFLRHHRRATVPALDKSGEKQGDHLDLSGASHAHLPLTTLHPPTTEEPAGTSGAVPHSETRKILCIQSTGQE